MNSIGFLRNRSIASIAFSVLVGSTFAVVGTTSKSVKDLKPDTAYGFVGAIRNAANGLIGSGVAIGPRTILTARHVIGSGKTNLGETITLGTKQYGLDHSGATMTYTYYDSQKVKRTTQVDISVVTLDASAPDLAGWYGIGSAKVGSPISMVGYGLTGTVNPAGDGYLTNGGEGTRYAAGNTVDRSAVYPTSGVGGGPILLSYLKSVGGAALGTHDSGGGWFQNGKLVAISAFTFNDTSYSYFNGSGKTVSGTGLPNYGFPRPGAVSYDSDGDGYQDMTLPGGTAFFGSGAIDLTDPQFRTYFSANGVKVQAVPEPASMAALGLGALALLRRRRKA